jgi:hypothetical protein
MTKQEYIQLISTGKFDEETRRELLLAMRKGEMVAKQRATDPLFMMSLDGLSEEEMDIVQGGMPLTKEGLLFALRNSLCPEAVDEITVALRKVVKRRGLTLPGS